MSYVVSCTCKFASGVGHLAATQTQATATLQRLYMLVWEVSVDQPLVFNQTFPFELSP